jgi:hypothetical protein
MMQILESYLRAVKRYLPRSQSDDIIKELSEDLRSQIDEKQAELGRPISDEEAMAFFKRHGDPMTVARRYRQDHRSLSIGWELIGPELFPMYLIFLSCNLAITIASVVVVSLILHTPILVDTFIVPVLAQIICLTLVFTILNLIRRKCPQPWYYPPAELAPMLPVSRWYSLAGLVMWASVTAWWLALPHFPGLILGTAAAYLKLAATWHRFYVPILLLLLASITQRILNLLHPNWTWLIPIVRMMINAASVPILYVLVFKSETLVVLAGGIQNTPHYQQLVEKCNGLIRWGILGPWLWIYTGISAVVYAWYCVPHVRRLVRRARGRVSSAAV